MNAGAPSAVTSTRLARIRLEAWLTDHRPESIADYVDRVFARTVQLRDPYADAELAALLIDRRRFVEQLELHLQEGAVCSHLVDALRLAWTFRQHGLPPHELERCLAPFVERIAPAAEAWAEPERSDFFYWAARLGWKGAPERFPAEGCELWALLRQCDYGDRPIERAQATLQTTLLEATDLSTPMSLAGALWVETALSPPDLPNQSLLRERLIAVQDADGSFTGASRHRASCVALVALSRMQGILPHDRNLG